jgi:chaperonin GroEL
LVSDAEVSNILQIEKLLKPIIQEGKKLLMIAPCSVNVVNTLSANVQKGVLKMCTVQPPSFGYKQHELMQDIALAVGAKYFSEKTGDDLSLIKFDDLGHAERVIVGRDSTIVITDKESSMELIDERVEQLWGSHKLTKAKGDKEFILSRIASLTGGVGVIYVGGNTDLEQKELYDRVDDAVCAVRSALEDGILPGGGVALMNIGETYKTKASIDESQAQAYDILAHALFAPVTQILENAGLNVDTVYRDELAEGSGYDVKRGLYGDLIELGVTDPCKVTKNALSNAVSVSTTILSTNAIITMARSYETTD